MVTLTKSLSINTVTLIGNLVTSEGKSTNLKNLLILDLKNNVKHSNLNSKIIFLRKCLRLKIAPKEISYLARRTISEVETKSQQIKEECRILRMRILEKERQITDSRKKLMNHYCKSMRMIGFSKETLD